MCLSKNQAHAAFRAFQRQYICAALLVQTVFPEGAFQSCPHVFRSTANKLHSAPKTCIIQGLSSNSRKSYFMSVTNALWNKHIDQIYKMLYATHLHKNSLD